MTDVLRAMALASARAFYLFSPLLLASLLSAVVLRFNLTPSLKRPIDGGHSFRGRRLFGDSKTWRGVVVAVVGCIAGVELQVHAVRAPAWLTLVDYGEIDTVLFGAAMGAGATFGELPNSFVKRRLGIAPGATTRGPLAAVFYLWDQIDLLTGAWPAVAAWVRPEPLVVAMSAAVTLSLHPLVSLTGYVIGARRSAR